MTFVDIETKQPPPEIIGACFLYKDSCIVNETFNINAILSKIVASSLAVSSSQDDHNWYHARRSDGKVGMFPGNYVKERRQNNGESVNAPQTPLKDATRMTGVSDQDEAPTAKPTDGGDVELSDMQVRTSGAFQKHLWALKSKSS